MASPPIDFAAVAEADDGDEHDAVVEIGDDAPIADAVFPEIAEVLAAQGFADAAGVVQRGDTVAQELRRPVSLYRGTFDLGLDLIWLPRTSFSISTQAVTHNHGCAG